MEQELVERTRSFQANLKQLKIEIEGIQDLEGMESYLAQALALETIVHTLLKIHGCTPKMHPIYNELQRLKGYFSRYQDRNHSRIDKNAAKRIIKHNTH
jgi:hypothetical protein